MYGGMDEWRDELMNECCKDEYMDGWVVGLVV